MNGPQVTRSSPPAEPARYAGSDGVAILTSAQAAALARLATALERPGSLAVCAGPAGTGTSTVLAQLAAAASRSGLTVDERPGFDIDPPAAPPAGADLVILDDAHDAADGALSRIVAEIRRRNAAARIVLAGRGRLFTLLARDPALESRVMLRAILRPFTAGESARLVSAVCGRGNEPPDALAGVAATIHEIAGGLPAGVIRLAEWSLLVLGSRPEQPLVAADIEALHRRLALSAA